MHTATAIVLFFFSLLIVGYGQPAALPWLGLLSGACGFALIFAVIATTTSPWKRFLIGTTWFTLVQLIQLYWFTSHPYSYIYLPYVVLSLGVGAQFGFLSLFIRPSILGSIKGCLTLQHCGR